MFKMHNFKETVQFKKRIFKETVQFKKRIFKETVQFKKRIFIINNTKTGDTLKYVNDLDFFNKNIIIKNKIELLSYKFNAGDVILIQQLITTDITALDLLKIKESCSITFIICIHDYYWFDATNNITYQNSYLVNNIIDLNVLNLFNNASLVIHPSNFTKMYYDKYFPTHNTIIQPHNDIIINKYKYIPHINKSINIGILQDKYKGTENIKLLQDIKTYKKFKINIIICTHTEDNWVEVINQNNLHGLLFLNKWGETYSYALTKGLQSGLPILYNNIGSFKERIPIDEHYVKVIDNEYEYHDKSKLFTCFKNWIDYIILNQNTFKKFPIENKMAYKDLYYHLLTNVCVPSIYKKIHTHIQPFAVYFPQFHRIKENDINYYNGMTDAINLYHCNKNKLLNEPLSILTYDLTNVDIIRKQVYTAKSYGIYGFSVYYYWFSQNEITNQHTIMEKCYDLFFNSDIQFNIFFIWANESWTGNPAFNTNKQIINTYDLQSCIKNSTNLIKYFKHQNYYKINNKPVFYIHHPWCFNKDELSLFIETLNDICILNGFHGVHLKVNNMNGDDGYDFNPNYKRNICTDYEKYVNNIKTTNCMFFNFNNNPRFHFSKSKPCTVYTNITEKSCSEMIKKSMNEGIVLINAWNEWGEQMAIEPGTISKNLYLLMIKHHLLKYLKQPIPCMSSSPHIFIHPQTSQQKNVYIISVINEGGSVKYLNDITSHYTNNFIYIRNKHDLSLIQFIKSDILFVQQLLFTDILPNDLIKIKKTYGVNIIISIHDFCWFIQDDKINNPLYNVWEEGYLNKLTINSSIIKLFEYASIVIHPSNFTLEHYNKYFPTHNSLVQPHNDVIDYTTKYIPIIKNNCINICQFQTNSVYKGSEYVDILSKYKKYKDFDINVIIISYTEQNWGSKLLEYNPHCLLHLNKYGETYCYSLSKSINSGLPILYNNIGAFKERIPHKEHYKIVMDESLNLSLLHIRFEEMLDYIIVNNGKYNNHNLTNTIQYNDFYNTLFYSYTNKITIILTATVTVNKLECLFQVDKNERINTYLKSILQWLHKTDFTIIIIENSGYTFEELNNEKKLYKNRFEVITFNESDELSALYLHDTISKSAHEIFAINYAFEHSKLIHSTNFIIKVTARFFVPLKDYIEQYDLDKYDCLVQNNRDRCEIVGSHYKNFYSIFNKNINERHIENVWKKRTNMYNDILICKEFNIEETIRGDIPYTTI
jgi:hypothetical protein